MCCPDGHPSQEGIFMREGIYNGSNLANGDCDMNDLPIIQKTYDLIKWYVPILGRLPQRHRFTLGERITNGLYDLLEGLITARYAKHKLTQLEHLNTRLEILRHQTRLLFDFELIAIHRYEFAGKAINAIGTDLGGWIKQQRQGSTSNQAI
jgi:hypothetical protein